MIRGSDRGHAVARLGPCHVFWFGGLCFTTAVWSDEPRTVEYVGPDEDAARKTAEDIDKKKSAMVESCLRGILKRIDGGERGID